MTVTELPRPAAGDSDPASSRWIPTRAGILNVWRYYDEVFEFHEGRLLLHGPNGSGKSKALELLLPFLFDANLRASRLSTFGTGERTMHWNLMGEGASGTTRVGYVWLEFALTDDSTRWFTCGARLQASSHTTSVSPDYFTTELRVGRADGLALVNDAGQPVTRKALEERLGSRGVVHGNAGDYRTEVRSTLFPTLNEQRFDALITALLQLRTPKLSQRLDPTLLSTLLSRALPPLGQEEITELAEGFERLDAQREKLARLEEEVAATRTLASRQRSYAQRVLRAAAATVISTTTALENRATAARESAEKYDLVSAAKDTAEARVAALEREIDTAEANREGLTQRDAYKKGQQLDQLRERTRQAQVLAGRVRVAADNCRAEAQRDEQAAHDAEQAAHRQAGIVQAREDESRQAAVRAGLVSVHTELTTPSQADSVPRRRLLRAAVRSREDQLATVERAVTAHEHAVDRRREAEEELEQARTAFAEARDRLEAAAEDRELALTDLRDRLVGWAAGCRELVFPDPSVLLDHIESEPALLAAVEGAAAPVLHDITRRETVHAAQLAAAAEQRDTLAAEVDRLSSEQDIPPSAPPTRTADRTRMTGAPLWRLVDFAGTVPESGRAGIEAALEAAGLLDAWVGRHGAIQGHDVFADPTGLAPVPGRSLADVLVPEPGTDVDPVLVRRLLETVACGEQLPAGSPAAIGADGTWRLGSLTGSWQKDHPSYVGARARRRARERRIDELRGQIRDLDAVVAELERVGVALHARRDVLRAERDARPGHAALSEADQLLTRAQSELDAADAAVRRRVEVVSDRERQVSRTVHDLTSLAAEHGLPTARSALATLVDAVATFHDQAGAWLDEHDRLLSAQHRATLLGTQAQRAVTNAREREAEAIEAEAEHARLAAMLETVDRTLGADYREILAEISALRDTLRGLNEEVHATRREVTNLAGELGRLDAQRTTDAALHDTAAAARDTAAHRFRHLTTGVLPADSGLKDLSRFEATLAASEGVRAVREAARLLAAEWPTVPHTPANLGDALHRLSESVHACRTTLSSRADLDLETDEDVQIFTAVVDGVRVGATELLRILQIEAEQSRHEITDRERELFDQTLTGDTRRHLAARIRQANELVDAMNARLELVRTASKVAVRLVWQIRPDLPAGTRTARDLLLKDPARLTDADRESLHRFFRDRIEQAKSDDTATSWEEQLAQVFDYTSWHQFVVKVDRANGDGWQLLTKKLHGALSGGEKAIALHLPLFAAVAAHYQAVPQAPRVILLDEVFVGVDTTNRGQVFGLLAALDLDMMLTSDHEWCTYSELSGISIHHLITGTDGDDAVTTARFTWNGHELLTG